MVKRMMLVRNKRFDETKKKEVRKKVKLNKENLITEVGRKPKSKHVRGRKDEEKRTTNDT